MSPETCTFSLFNFFLMEKFKYIQRQRKKYRKPNVPMVSYDNHDLLLAHLYAPLCLTLGDFQANPT